MCLFQTFVWTKGLIQLRFLVCERLKDAALKNTFGAAMENKLCLFKNPSLCGISIIEFNPHHLHILPQCITMQINPSNGTKNHPIDLSSPVTLPGALLAPASSTSSSLTTRRSSANSSSSMQTSYRLPHPLPPLPVRKGVRGRRPKSQTIALLKAAAEAAAAAAAVNGVSQSPGSEAPMAPRPHKKRGPKPKNKVGCHQLWKPSGHCQLTLTIHFNVVCWRWSEFNLALGLYWFSPLDLKFVIICWL